MIFYVRNFFLFSILGIFKRLQNYFDVEFLIYVTFILLNGVGKTITYRTNLFHPLAG